MNEPLLVETQEIPIEGGHVLEVRLEGEFLFSSGIDVVELVLKKLSQNTKGIILDLNRLGYIDSAGLGGLASLSMKAARKGARLAVFGVNPRVEGMLRASHLQGIFLMMETREEALRYIRSEQ